MYNYSVCGASPVSEVISLAPCIVQRKSDASEQHVGDIFVTEVGVSSRDFGGGWLVKMTLFKAVLTHTADVVPGSKTEENAFGFS